MQKSIHPLKSKNSKFLGPEPFQAWKIMPPIDFPPRETYRVLEFWQFKAKNSSFLARRFLPLPLKIKKF
jgi:hypothetical protein